MELAILKLKADIKVLKPLGSDTRIIKRIESYQKAIDYLNTIDKELVLFEFGYQPCIHESVMGCVSLHRTRKGAEMAMDFHKEEKRKRWKEVYPTVQDQIDMPFGTHEAWDIYESKVLD